MKLLLLERSVRLALKHRALLHWCLTRLEQPELTLRVQPVQLPQGRPVLQELEQKV